MIWSINIQYTKPYSYHVYINMYIICTCFSCAERHREARDGWQRDACRGGARDRHELTVSYLNIKDLYLETHLSISLAGERAKQRVGADDPAEQPGARRPFNIRFQKLLKLFTSRILEVPRISWSSRAMPMASTPALALCSCATRPCQRPRIVLLGK